MESLQYYLSVIRLGVLLLFVITLTFKLNLFDGIKMFFVCFFSPQPLNNLRTLSKLLYQVLFSVMVSVCNIVLGTLNLFITKLMKLFSNNLNLFAAILLLVSLNLTLSS